MIEAVLWAEYRRRVADQVRMLEVYFKYRLWDRTPAGHVYRSMMIAAQVRSPRDFLRITYLGA